MPDGVSSIMSNKRTPGRSLDEWRELVTGCRQSGLFKSEVYRDFFKPRQAGMNFINIKRIISSEISLHQCRFSSTTS